MPSLLYSELGVTQALPFTEEAVLFIVGDLSGIVCRAMEDFFGEESDEDFPVPDRRSFVGVGSLFLPGRTYNI